VGIAYTKGWLEDIGCVAWDDLMEDLATLEISRAQTWQWLHHGVDLDDGEKVSRDLVVKIFHEEMGRIEDEIRVAMSGLDGHAVEAEINRYHHAQQIACSIFTEEDFRPFLKMSSDLVSS
jgi:malate synthase